MLPVIAAHSGGQILFLVAFCVLYCLSSPAKSTENVLPSSYFGGLTFIEGRHPTRKLSITEEGLDVILGKAVVLEHSVELL